ncbi:DUF5320 domain-containing protein [Thermodesulfobacteriota bacterium]
MPGLDRTGPMGEGAMTGGGRGLCNPSGRPYSRPGFGQGRGFKGGHGPSVGRGRGYRRGSNWNAAYPPYYSPYGRPYSVNPENEVNILKGEADAMKSELDAIQNRIDELESESS